VEVAKILGARDLFMYDLPDNRFDTVPFLDITKKIENLVARISPGVIYTHHNGDLNLDHVLVHRAVLTATRPIKGYPVKEIYAFEVPSSTDWSFQRLEPNFRPNVFVDISQTLEAKMKAISIYETEIRDFPHPRSMEAIRASATRWGSVAGCIAAEAFELVRLIK
jgi:LmbE family N-acetylglucosaminyl deacetylase